MPVTKSHGKQTKASEVVLDSNAAGGEELTALSYEAAFAQLEEILLKLESDDLSLDLSLTLYEQGMTLVDHCTGMLDSATLRVQQWQDDEPTTNFDGWQEG